MPGTVSQRLFCWAGLSRINVLTRTFVSHLIGIQIDGPDSFFLTKTGAGRCTGRGDVLMEGIL